LADRIRFAKLLITYTMFSGERKNANLNLDLKKKLCISYIYFMKKWRLNYIGINFNEFIH